MDKRNGFVSNKFWLAATTVATLSTVYDSVLSGQLRVLVGTLFSFMLTFMVALAMFRVGLFGGSDAKALIVLSLYIPTMSPFLHSQEVSFITSLSTLANLFMFFAIILGINALRNLYFLHCKYESLMPTGVPRKRGLLLLCGYRILHLGNQLCRKVSSSESDTTEESSNRNCDREKEPSSYPSRATKAKNDPSYLISAISWEPLKIPLIPIITLSLLFSLFFGDISIIFSG
jgi:preflagellin peptidase FlaK